jgi:hypothetical protein
MNVLPEQDFPPGRHRALKEHLMEEIRHDRVDNSPAQHGRWLRPGLAAAAVATAVALTFVVTGNGGRSAPAPAASQATKLLQNIALAAEKTAVPTGVRNDQYVYIREEGASLGSGKPPALEPLSRNEFWLSVDGTRPGLVNEPGMHNVPLAAGPPGSTDTRSYRYLQTLPTDPDQMLKWLRTHSTGGKSTDQNAFVEVETLIAGTLPPPAVSAALYRAAAKIPGVVVVPDAVDAIGRHGVAVARVGDDKLLELIFDKKTYIYLGHREIAADTTSWQKKGQTVAMTAIEQRTIVDKPGQRR